MNRHKTRIAILMLAAFAASGCGILRKSAPKTPVLGERVSVLSSDLEIAADPATAALPMTLPQPVANAQWAQPGGNASKSMGHLALGSARHAGLPAPARAACDRRASPAAPARCARRA